MSIGQKNSLTPRISWQAQNVEMPELDRQRLALWLQKVTEEHNRILDGLGYIFCDDETILDVNRQFLSHDYYTDIITFDYCRGKMVRGDMYISLDTVVTNAETMGEPYARELLRVIVHGVLHLCGINDKGPGEREIMEAHENAALEMWDNMTA
ncbi:MAG: rRNA maturation RNase YbeY [Muribaculaceae bacterium]